MKRTLSILVAVLLATSLVWGATLLDTNSTGLNAYAVDTGPTSAEAKEASGVATATYDLYVEVDFSYIITGSSPVYASCGVSASWDNDSTYPDSQSDTITSGSESGTARLPSSGTVNTDIANVWVKVSAASGAIPSDADCSVNEWRIYSAGRRIIVITGG